MEKQEIGQWAKEEFGTARLGHASKESCLVRVGGLIAARPAPHVTEIAKSSADRQAIYGFLENDCIDPEEITHAAGRAALGRSDSDADYLLVPVDGTSLCVTDRLGKEGFGQVGIHKKGRGLQVQSALVLNQKGTPLGVLAQRYWARPDPAKKTSRSKIDRRPTNEKETQKWLEALSDCAARVAEVTPRQRLWFQMDRGYDCWPILQQMEESAFWYTVRGAYNRALWTPGKTKEGKDDLYVQDALAGSELIGTLSLAVAGSRSRTARTAKLSLRATQVTVRLTDPSKARTPHQWPSTLSVVQVCEEQTTPPGEKPICWTLWTNRDIRSAEDARQVVDNYAARWRVEEFHRLWKSGAMRVEESQLRAGDHFERFTRLAACVACRLLRLTYLARTSPQRPAEAEFNATEIQALKLFAPRKGSSPPQHLEALSTVPFTISQAVQILADLGGYTGKSSGGPPGALILARGFRELQQIVRALNRLPKIRDQW